MNSTDGGVAVLRQRLAAYRSQVAAQNARVEQAQAAVTQAEQAIVKEFNLTPDQLAAELTKVNAEIQTLAAQISGQLVQAGV